MSHSFDFPPISVLPQLLAMATDALDSAKDQLRNFQRAKERPYSLDKQTIDHVIRAYTEHKKYIGHQKMMCAAWRTEKNLTSSQKRELNTLEDKLLQLEEATLLILNLANHCKLKTIESIIAQNEPERAINTLQEWLSDEAPDEDDFFDEVMDEEEEGDEEIDENDEEEDFDSEEIECLHCGEIVARLIYADEMESLDALEDYAAEILSTITPTPYPTWIVAEGETDFISDAWDEKEFVKQIFPINTPAERISSEHFEDALEVLAESHCEDFDDEDREESEEEGASFSQSNRDHKLTQLNEIMMKSLLELSALADPARPQELFDFVKTFLLGVISTSIDLVNTQQPALSTALYAEVEAIGKMGGLRAIADFQNKFSDRTYSVSQIADDDLETAMNYIGQELGSTLSKTINELPMPLRQPETHLRGIEALLSNVLNQRFTNPHEILDALCEHVHMALNSLNRRVH